MPYRALAAAILVQWREAERKLRAATPGTPEAEELERTLDRLRGDYQRAIEEARRHHLPEPRPMPSTSD